ncbi:putative serine/threonine protein kinase IRE4 [Citrus sinensis]|uniref:Serine/threonine protein kinase IRE4 n=1 Tax=Citrus sinensis TaxID=2711 RepID=A0ACB8KW75_CITSI|nr:putative serine/threonine protein kinase IRE4 [Citrus sinensis]
MAEASRNNHDNGIPSGLNRIKTRGGVSKPDELTESRSYGVSRPPQKHKQKTVAQGHVKLANSSTEEVRKGKKIAQWFTSYISKFNIVSPNTENSGSEDKDVDVEDRRRTKLRHEGNHLNEKQSLAEHVSSSKVSKGLKSFSHELGPKGGIPSSYPRAHSYNDLKELLDTLHSRFDAAKEVVNSELATFAKDVMNVLEKMDSPSSEGKEMLEDLLILAQQCIEMTSCLFRANCEAIVQDLTEKRQQCQVGLVKWLSTRMLFILTRCTRLLLFQKESEPIAEKSLHKFKKCLESVPAVETSWVPSPGTTESDLDYASYQKANGKKKISGQQKVSTVPEISDCSCSESLDHTSENKSVFIEQNLPPQKSQHYPRMQEQQSHLVEGRIVEVTKSNCGSPHEQGQSLDGSDSVICRICEEVVPISHLESHSYICAYADKCELNCLDVDERLLKLSEILEQISESCNSSSHPILGSPENSRTQTMNSAITYDGYSPKISEWRNKGVEGMFEDIHEMDTACIDDSHLGSLNLRGHLGLKLSGYGASSSTGSMTSVSSTNTPKAGHFDPFWLERNHPAELEDVQQMIELADIARCVADTDFSKEGSEFLLACMHDLQDVLQHSKLKALVLKKLDMIRKNDIERILAERNILITVRNPFVVRFFYSFTCRDNLYLVMEYLNGGDLYSLLRKVGCLEEDVARIYIAELVLALEYLHSLGIVHRDLKPDNLLIAHDGHIKLTDFGLSKIGLINNTIDLSGPETDGIMPSDAHYPEYQQTDNRNRHSAVGTPDYLAPEILLGTEHGYAADWWSVGIILFEFITGIPPFTAESPEIIFDNILNRKIPWPCVPSDMSFEAQDLINRLDVEHPYLAVSRPQVRSLWFLIHDPNQRLGANGAAEVKAHPFFKGVNWDSLALQKAVFVPQPESVDDTSYFLSRFSQISSGLLDDQNGSYSDADTCDSSSNSRTEMDECGDLAEFGSCPLDLSLINFSFKNLSQLASINHEVLVQNVKDSTRSSPAKDAGT